MYFVFEQSSTNWCEEDVSNNKYDDLDLLQFDEDDSDGIDE